MNHITDGLYQMQGHRLAGQKLTVPCTKCKKPIGWDEVTWLMKMWTPNEPYCKECYNDVVDLLAKRAEETNEQL